MALLLGACVESGGCVKRQSTEEPRIKCSVRGQRSFAFFFFFCRLAAEADIGALSSTVQMLVADMDDSRVE